MRRRNLIFFAALMMLLFVVSVIMVMRSDIGTGPLETVVSSEDGRASIVIPLGALPEGMSTDQISVTNVTPEVGGNDTVLVYELKPHGINLRLPVRLVITMNAMEEGLWNPGRKDMVLPDILHLGDDGKIALSEDTERSVDLDGMTVRMEMPLRTFSFAFVNRSPIRIRFFQFPDGAHHPVGTRFTVESLIHFEPKQETIRITTGQSDYGERVEYDHVFGKQRNMYYGGKFRSPSFVVPSLSQFKPEGSYIEEGNISDAYDFLKCNREGTGRLEYEMFYYYSQEIAMIRTSDGQEVHRNDYIREGVWELTMPVSCQVDGTEGYDDSGVAILPIQTMLIDGEAYPVFQFGEWDGSDGRCEEAHYHAIGDQAISLDGSRLDDPAPDGCGFGGVSGATIMTSHVSERVLVQWLNEFWHGQ